MRIFILVYSLFVTVFITESQCSEQSQSANPVDNDEKPYNKRSIWSRILEVNAKLNDTVLYDGGEDGTFSTAGAYSLEEGDIRRYENEERQQAPSKKNLSPPFYWHRHMWGRIIPYEIDYSLVSITSMIEGELRKLEKVTCLRFRKKIPSDEYWIFYSNGRDCSSGVGRSIHNKGRKGISLAPLCRDPGTILHETLHNLGFWHEQSRPDRDSFVTLFENNIQKDALSQYFKRKFDLLLTPYDRNSVMHYDNLAFVISHQRGDAIQHKFDPNYPLGGHVATPSDIAELNMLYQCDIKSGWSRWSGYSHCILNYWKQCLKANVRFCTSLNWNECPNHNRHGAQEHVVECDMRECDFPKINGIWGNWAPFSRCSTSCNWGFKTRFRQCNNPTPRNGGKNCPGSNRQDQLCRRRRCRNNVPVPNGADNDFEGNIKKGFEMIGFRRKYGKANIANSGPTRDHTSSIDGTGGGYALATKERTSFVKKIAKLKSPWIYTALGREKCVTFFYMLNGKTLHKQALFMYVEYRNGQRRNLPFLRGGHQGNYWRRAAVKIPPINTPFRFVFEARFHIYLFADVAIDDVMFDHEKCLVGLEGCSDYDKRCLQWAKENRCKKKGEMERMLSTCCASCSNPNKELPPAECKKDNKESCEAWAQNGECKKNPAYMNKECCMACKNLGKKKVCKDSNSSCKKWASIGECKKNPGYMLVNCCQACKDLNKPKIPCVNKASETRCGAGGRSGDCKRARFKKWMADNCCQTCLLLENPKSCTGNQNLHSKCGQWAKEGECRKNPWVITNCCPACKSYA